MTQTLVTRLKVSTPDGEIVAETARTPEGRFLSLTLPGQEPRIVREAEDADLSAAGPSDDGESK